MSWQNTVVVQAHLQLFVNRDAITVSAAMGRNCVESGHGSEDRSLVDTNSHRRRQKDQRRERNHERNRDWNLVSAIRTLNGYVAFFVRSDGIDQSRQYKVLIYGNHCMRGGCASFRWGPA